MDIMTQRDKNEFHAHKMLEIFFRGYEMDLEYSFGLVTNDTLLGLKEQFGKVKEKDRADVFIMFTNMLHKRNIDFNVKQFQI